MSQIVRYLSEIARCGAQHRNDTLCSMGLKACHTSYLVQICENPGISQDRLARMICINKSNVARQVAYLEEEGFITRETCSSDKRVTELYPTQKAWDLLPSMYGMLQSWENLLTQDLTEDDKEVLCRLLGKMHPHAARYMDNR